MLRTHQRAPLVCTAGLNPLLGRDHSQFVIGIRLLDLLLDELLDCLVHFGDELRELAELRYVGAQPKTGQRIAHVHAVQLGIL
jgi:hypothetical protein